MSNYDVIRSGMISTDALEFLWAAAIAGVNVIIAGDTGTGKTTVIDAIVAWLDKRPEPVKPNVTSNAGLLTPIRQGVPYLSELTVPSGSESLLHLYTLMLAAAPAMTQTEFYELLNQTPTLLIELQQLKDTSRRITLIAEILPDGALMTMYYFELTHEEQGRIMGRMRPEVLSLSRRTLDRIEAAGIDLPPPLFGPWYRPPGTHVSSPWVTIRANKRREEAKTDTDDDKL